MLRRRGLLWVVGLAAALYFSLVETVGLGLYAAVQGRAPSWADTASRTGVVWLSFLVGLPWCLFMARRFPIRGDNWRSRVPLHLAGALVFCAVHIVADVLLQALVHGDALTPQATVRSIASLFGYYAAVESIVYWAIVGALLLAQHERDARDRDVHAARLESALSEARMAALRVQLAPHFLFNTLNGIAAIARRGDSDRVSHAIGELGELLRVSLDRSIPSQIPLAQELEFLERYLALQSLRFPDRLRVERSIEPGTERALVPAFVLQPLIENAVHHGLKALEGGTVTLAAARRGDRLQLTVSDTGAGFRQASNDESRTNGGIGLGNTRARLAAVHGPRAEIRCENLETGGARVSVELPFVVRSEP